MATKFHNRVKLLSLVLGIALVGLSAYGAMPQKMTVAKKPQVAIGLAHKSATKDEIEGAVRQQLGARGVSASEQEVQAAARQALDLIGKAKDPEKGVIYVNTKKFTICASWGKDKDFCKSH